MGVDKGHIDAFKKVYVCMYVCHALLNSKGLLFVQGSMYMKG